jgi:hypothetical protein
MFVTFSPADGDAQRWSYDPDEVMASKAEMIEKRFGASWEAFGAAVIQGSMRARRVLLWHLMTLTHPSIRYEDVADFRSKDLLVEFSAAELVRMRDRLAKANLPEAEREQITTALDIQITDAMAREELDTRPAADSGKALSSADASSTG